MGLSKEKIYCSIRKEQVSRTQEELVRLKLVDHLIKDLEFPSGYLLLEKSLKEMPHLALTDKKMPARRADIVCFAKNIHREHELFPLLLIECKAVKLTQKVISQVSGYNYYVQAKFIAVVNQVEMQFGFYDHSLCQYQFIPYIPNYNQLLLSISE